MVSAGLVVWGASHCLHAGRSCARRVQPAERKPLPACTQEPLWCSIGHTTTPSCATPATANQQGRAACMHQGVQGDRCQCHPKFVHCLNAQITHVAQSQSNWTTFALRAASCISQLSITTGEPRMLSYMQTFTHPTQVSLLNVLQAAPVGFLSNKSILAMLA